MLHIRLLGGLNYRIHRQERESASQGDIGPSLRPVRKPLCTNLSPGQNARLSLSTILVLVQPPRERLFSRFSAVYASECATIRDVRHPVLQERRTWVGRMIPRQGALQGAAPGIEKRLKNVDVKYVVGSSFRSFQWQPPASQPSSRTLYQAICI